MPIKRGTLNLIILSQSLGMISMTVFQNGFMLTFLSALGLSQATILALLALPQLMFFLLILPFAFLSDRMSKKKVGIWGHGCCIGGFLILWLAPLFSSSHEISMYFGIGLFGAGAAIFGSSWFALLKPIVPEEIRGRFFGTLRASWQIVAIVFTFLTTLVLQEESSPFVFQTILGIITLFLVIRLVLYLRIPEVPQPSEKESLWHSLKFIIKIPGYLQFCCYLFLLMLFVGNVPWIFNLLEQQYLGFSDDEIVLMGNFLAGGFLLGFYFGGKSVDRWGTRPVFLSIHFLFGIVLFAFISRAWMPLPSTFFLGLLTTIFGICLAASSVASSTEMMLLIPNENVSLSTALNVALTAGGTALSGILAGQILDLQILNTSWQLWGEPMNELDSILLGCGTMVLLLVVTLGLIPSVTGQRQLYPVNRL